MNTPEMPTEQFVVPSPPKRRRTGLIIGIAVTVLVVAAASSAATVSLTRRDSVRPAAVASASPTPAAVETTEPPPTTPAPVQLDPRTLCNTLIPTLQDSANIALAMATIPDGSTVDQAKLSLTIAELGQLAAEAPNSMVLDIQTQETTLQSIESVLTTGVNQTLTFEGFKESGTRLAGDCLPYATN